MRNVFVLFLLFASLSLTASAVEVNFPQDPAQWVNSAPLSSQLLKGKAAFLWFYEEGCPSCRKRWPEMLQMARKYEGKPIAFIAINSGNSRKNVEEYAREVSLDWPVVVDTSRQFEKDCEVGTISLQNIYQGYLLSADGNLQYAGSSNFEEQIDGVLKSAKWNVDPANIPAPLKGTWMSVEFGDYASAAALLKKGMASKKAEIQEASTKLHDYVHAELTKAISEADKLAGQNDWTTYKALADVKERFAGYELPASVTEKLKELESSADVKAEKVRKKQFDAAKKGLNSTNRAARQTAALKLKKLIDESPTSDSAQEARKLLEALDSAGN